MPLSRVALASAALIFAASAAHADPNRYEAQVVVSDGFVKGAHVDPHLVNGWGVAFNPAGFVWVSDNGTGLSTLYDGLGNPQSLVVTIPSANGTDTGKPTGIVFSGSADFVVKPTPTSTLQGPSRFIFATEDGVIAGWAPNVDFTHALVGARTAGAVYKGLALGTDGGANFLYATDFVGGKVDVFDRTFTPVVRAGAFVDPKLPKGYAPFNIQNIDGSLFVTYARRKDGDTDETAGKGLGIVSQFDTHGRFLRRFATGDKLNAPWGIAHAPSTFGKFSNDLLIGNFGDGRISAYDIATGKFRGQLHGAKHGALKLDGLWGMAFGNGLNNQPTDTLFFAAGPDDENHGAYGRISALPDDGMGDDDNEDDSDDD